LSLNKQGDKLWVSLKTLNIDFRNIVFDDCEFQDFQFPTGLTSLNLNFVLCKLRNEVVKNLTSQGLKSLTQLTSFTLSFSYCQQITNEKVINLASQGLKYLTQLTSLTLNFSRCPEITDEGVSKFAFQALKHFTLLICFILNERVIKDIYQHHQIREDQGLTNKSLHLNFIRPESSKQLRPLVDDSPRSTRSFENNNLERRARISKLNEEIEGFLNRF